MTLRKTLCFPLVVLAGTLLALAQDPPNLANGAPPLGSYENTDVDTVNLMNGNLMLHIPLPITTPQRGKLSIRYYLVVNAKTWFAVGNPSTDTGQWGPSSVCLTVPPTSTGPCGQGAVFVSTASFAMTRTYQKVFTEGQGTDYAVGVPEGLGTWDGSNHGVIGNFAPDASGYQVIAPEGGCSGIGCSLPNNATIIDRDGTQFQGGWNLDGTTCSSETTGDPGNQTTTTNCNEHFILNQIVDANGNVLDPPIPIPDIANPNTNGPTVATHLASSSETAGCLTSFGTPWVGYLQYPAPNGQTNQIKLCFATYPQLNTSFSPTGIHQFQDVYSGHPFPGNYRQPVYLSNVILPDNSQWSISYDSYGEITSVETPTGGSIAYTWAEGSFPITSAEDITSVSRAVKSRQLTDINGNVFTWSYHWSPEANDQSMTHTVTDANGNDTDHVFKPIQVQPTQYPYNYKETRLIAYQGSGSSRTALKQVDTAWQIKADGDLGVPTDITTTMFANGLVNLSHTDYDLNSPTLGLPVTQKQYDWGSGGHGALLKEVDTTYQWQNNGQYLTANILDAPFSVITKDANGNRFAETDYTYDESAYLTSYEGTVGALPSGTHLPAPNPVRGNPTSISKWLNTAGSVISHTNWYDTGEPHLAIDALGNQTTYSYHLAYNGALLTETCRPSTNGVAHCVSGTYDSNTGLITSFTNENATSQASGTTPGDSAHTSSYAYDTMARLTSALSPPDPSNGGAQALTQFNYPIPMSLPFAVTRTKSITSSLTDSITSTYDGIGRVFKTRHPLPNGTAEVDTQYDGLSHVVSVTNPYFSTSDPTYGKIQTQYDALGRVTQVTDQDGSVQKLAYDVVPIQAVTGDCTKNTDEAGNQRMGCTDALGRLIEAHEPGDTFNGSQAQGSLGVSGSLQSYTIPGTNGTVAHGNVTISGSEQFISGGTYCAVYDENGDCVDWEQNPPIYDAGTITITVNGHSDSYAYGQNDTSASIAAGLVSAINGDSASPVTAGASAGTVNLTTKTTGSAANYSLSASYSYDNIDFSGPSFTTSTSGASLTGGTNGTAPVTVYDSGTVTVTVGSFSASVSYSQSGNSTAAQVASATATGLSASNSPVTASASGSTLSITYKTVGTAGNTAVTCSSSTSQGTYFSSPSFNCGGTTLAGGYNAEGSSLDFNYFVTQYNYDPLGNLLGVTQKGDPTVTNSSQWRVRNFTYDSLSRLTQALNPESGTITYGYDANSNLITKTDGRGITTNYSPASSPIDPLNRVTMMTFSDGTPTVTYHYDQSCCGVTSLNPVGRMTSANTPNTELVFSYDIMGNITTQWDCPPSGIARGYCYVINAQYNLGGSLTQLTYPNGEILKYTPWNNGTLAVAGLDQSAVDNGNGINYVSAGSYGPHLSITGFTSGQSSSFSGVTNSLQYNPRLQVCRMTSLTTGSLPTSCTDSTHSGNVLDLGYNFSLGSGDNGNVLGITNYKDTTRNQSFTYDLLNRLSSAQNAGTNCSATPKPLNPNQTKFWGNNYAYDSWGNLLTKVVTKCSAENLSVTADAHNQIHATSGSDYTYDAAGNMTQDVTFGHKYGYDAKSRIAQIDSGAATYTYNPESNRVRKDETGSPSTEYFYFNGNAIAELNPATGAETNYIFFNGERVARRDSTGSLEYYFSDFLKTTDIVTNAQGTILNESDFYPWGGELQFSANDSNRYKFTGKERDTETGLDYFGVRYYSNSLGRFSTPDPLRASARLTSPQTWNRYAYVHGNPLAFADFEGLTDYYVFRPLYNSDGPTWSAVRAQARSGDTVTVYNGRDATAANFYKAMETPGARVVTAGHTLDYADQSQGGRETAGSIELRNSDNGQFIGVGTSGEIGVQLQRVPAPDPSLVSAESLAVFGCYSNDLASQYPSVIFTGIDTFFEPDEEGASAYVSALLSGSTFDQAGAAAQKAMQTSVQQSNQTNHENDPMPNVKTHAPFYHPGFGWGNGVGDCGTLCAAANPAFQ